MDHSRYAALIERLEKLQQANPRAYKLRLVGLVVLGYGYLLSVLAVVIALLGASVLSLFFLKFAAIKVIAVLGTIALVLLRALWVYVPRPFGYIVDKRTAPELIARVERLRQELKAPRFHRVLITDDFNAGVRQVPLLGLFGWHQNYLLIGLPLLKCLTPEQLDAVLAHEFGHLAGGHARFGNWLYRARASWQQLLQEIDSNGGAGAFVFKRFFHWYVPYFQASAFPLARANEYEADATAARLTSPQQMAQALTGVELAGTLLNQRFWPELHRHADEVAQPNFLPFSEMGRGLAADLTGNDGERWLQECLSQQTGLEDTHPALSDRLKALGQPALVAPPAEGDSADRLLGNERERIIATYDRRWQDQIIYSWSRRHAAAQEERAQLDELDRQAGERELQAGERVQRALLRAGIGRDRAAGKAELQAAAADHPDHAEANFYYGQILIEDGDEAGVTPLLRALELDQRCGDAVGQLLYGFHMQRGEPDKAQAWLQRLRESAQQARAAEAERASYYAHDPLQAHGLADEVVATVTATARETGVHHAWLARRVLKLSAPAQYVIGIRTTGTLRLHNAEKAAALAKRLVSRLEGVLPSEFLVIIVDGDNVAYESSLDKIAGAQLF